MVISFWLMTKYKKIILQKLLATGLPSTVLYFIVAAPLIIVEEQTSCQPQWCLKTVIPPTFVPVLFFMLLLFLAIKLFNPLRLKKVVYWFAFFGILFEFSLGGSRMLFWSLAKSNFLLFLFFIFWVAFTYIYVAFLPVSILLNKKTAV